MSGEIQQLREQIGQAVLESAQVDREAGRIGDVPLLGRVSENNRRYTEQAMKDAVRLYRGAPLYIDHPRRSEQRDRGGVRSVRDLAGKIMSPRKVGDRVRGDLHLLEAEPARSLILSLAETMPGQAGLSHRARGEVRIRDDGQQEVVSLEEVHGVELVTEPATVAGLQESIQQDREARREVEEQLSAAGVLDEVSEHTVAYLAGLPEEKREAEIEEHYTPSTARRGGRSRRSRSPASVSVERDVEALLGDRGTPRTNGSLPVGKVRLQAGELEEAHRRIFGK